MGRYWLIACAAQMGLVAGLGCDSRALDPTDPHMPGNTPPVDPAAVWIAFDSDGGSGRGIWVIRVDQSARRWLTTGSSTEVQPTFSHDGTKLAYASDQGGVMQIYLKDL